MCVIFIAMPRSEQETFQRIIVKYVPLQALILSSKLRKYREMCFT